METQTREAHAPNSKERQMPRGRIPFTLGRGGPGPVRVIEFFTRPGCHLCDAAREVLERVTAGTDVRILERNIDLEPELRDRYGELIPVVLVDGERFATWRVDEERLRARLARR